MQEDHLHLVVEAEDRRALCRGLQGLAIRLAKAINRTLHIRGQVVPARYHARALRTPREVRRALAYVIQNWRKHDPRQPPRAIDPCSSGMWFDGWVRRPAPPAGPPPVAAAQTWLAAVGWRRHGLIGSGEAPAPPA